MEENTGVEQEVAIPSTEETSTESSQEAETPKRDDANWKEAREVMKQQQQEIQELKRFNSDKKTEQAHSDFDELDSLASDDIVTVGQARKMAEQIAQRTAVEVSRKNEGELRKLEMLSQFSDFNSVVSDENIKKLEREHPAIAEGIAKSSNPYKGAYDVIKAFYSKNHEDSAAAKAVEENLSKPKSVHSQGYKGPLAEASRFESSNMTSDKRAEVWKLAQQYAAGR